MRGVTIIVAARSSDYCFIGKTVDRSHVAIPCPCRSPGKNYVLSSAISIYPPLIYNRSRTLRARCIGERVNQQSEPNYRIVTERKIDSTDVAVLRFLSPSNELLYEHILRTCSDVRVESRQLAALRASLREDIYRN